MPLLRNGLRNRYILALDVLLIPFATWLAHVVRFEGLNWPPEYATVALTYLLISLPIKIALLFGFRLYRRLWRFASVADLESVLACSAVSALAGLLLGAVILPSTGLISHRVPLAVLVLDGTFTTMMVALPRLLVRSIGWHRFHTSHLDAQPVLIAGAGSAGVMLLRQIQSSPSLSLEPVGFVDDDVAKHRHRISGIPVLGPLKDMARICREAGVKEVLIA